MLIFYDKTAQLAVFKKPEILTASFSVKLALIRMCMTATSHSVSLKVSGEGALWQRRQFSPQSCAPDLASARLFVEEQLLMMTVTAMKVNIEIMIGIFFILIDLCE